MRRALPIALLALLLACPSAVASSGGTVYEPPAVKKTKRKKAKRARPGGPVLASLTLNSRRLFLFGSPASVSFRIDGRTALADVRLYLTPRGSRTPASTIKLGPRPRRVVQRVTLTGRENGQLPQGEYEVRLGAKDSRGRRLRRAPRIAGALPLRVAHHRFPLIGPFTYGGEGSRFGSPRGGRHHQGQDLAAAEGTPIVAPRGGVVEAVQYQASGAGHYVVLDGAQEDRDYVFMHLRAGSIPVREGQTVRTGQRIGEVGNTGRSFGAHLHFEVWGGAGWFAGGKPVDPLPLLRSWPR
jgi:murein DD-endopeptidase MepM/ murein hydrolase activator NlpD